MYRSSEGCVHRNDMIMSLLKLSRNSSQEELQQVYTLSLEETYSRVQEASRILLLEERFAIYKFVYTYTYNCRSGNFRFREITLLKFSRVLFLAFIPKADSYRSDTHSSMG